MKEWEYTFDSVSKADWIKQIETDLRQRSIHSLDSQWWEGEPLTPLVHREDLEIEPVRLPDYFFVHPPIIIEWLDANAALPTEVNRKILEALQYGAQSIILHTRIDNVLPFDQWLQDLLTQIISITIEPDQIQTDQLNKLLPDIQNDFLLRILRTNNSENLKSILERLTTVEWIKTLRFVYRFQSDGDWITETARILSLILKDIDEWESLGLSPKDYFEQCILLSCADADYYKQIIELRVLHLLWQNLRRLYLTDTCSPADRYLECHIEQSTSESPDHFLIRASMSALAASISGVHFICIHQPQKDEIPGFYQRINRNIHHLLQYESGMYKGSDPLSGAYAIEFHTRRWCEKIWELVHHKK